MGWEVHEKARKILDGLIDDPTWYPVIYGIDENADPGDEANWYKANPSLDITIDIDKVRAAWQSAKDNPAEERLFRQLRLNQWVKYKTTKWLTLEQWDQCGGLVVPEKLRGRPCYGGLDLSSKLDITAFVLVFPPIDSDPKTYALPYFWIPEDNMKERIRKDSVPYDKWLKEGLIKVTPGNVIDYDFIKKTILQLKDIYDIQEIGFDPWNAMQVALDLTDAGLTMVEVRQGAKTMSPAMKELETLVVSRRLVHGANPVLRWMFGNIEVKYDENENIRPVKSKSADRIDGIVALINALARTMVHDKPQHSVYEDRGIITL
nr:terminase TerL endonuclease subunit [Mahella australiensis]